MTTTHRLADDIVILDIGINWPTIGARVAVTYPGTEWHDPETVTGTVVSSDHGSIDIRRYDDGDVFTLFDSEIAAGTAAMEVLG